jgi:hypothetical protein
MCHIANTADKQHGGLLRQRLVYLPIPPDRVPVKDNFTKRLLPQKTYLAYYKHCSTTLTMLKILAQFVDGIGYIPFAKCMWSSQYACKIRNEAVDR